MQTVILFIGKEVETTNIKSSESLKFKITSCGFNLSRRKEKCIFLLQLHVCMCMYIFSVDSLKLVIKKLSGQANPPEGGGGGTARWDIYVPLHRPVFKELSLGLDIEIREQLLDSEEFGKFSLV